MRPTVQSLQMLQKTSRIDSKRPKSNKIPRDMEKNCILPCEIEINRDVNEASHDEKLKSQKGFEPVT